MFVTGHVHVHVDVQRRIQCICMYIMHRYMNKIENHNSLGHKQPSGLDAKLSPNECTCIIYYILNSALRFLLLVTPTHRAPAVTRNCLYRAISILRMRREQGMHANLFNGKGLGVSVLCYTCRKLSALLPKLVMMSVGL